MAEYEGDVDPLEPYGPPPFVNEAELHASGSWYSRRQSLSRFTSDFYDDAERDYERRDCAGAIATVANALPSYVRIVSSRPEYMDILTTNVTRMIHRVSNAPAHLRNQRYFMYRPIGMSTDVECYARVRTRFRSRWGNRCYVEIRRRGSRALVDRLTYEDLYDLQA